MQESLLGWYHIYYLYESPWTITSQTAPLIYHHSVEKSNNKRMMEESIIIILMHSVRFIYS